jgi:hypothetical protein
MTTALVDAVIETHQDVPNRSRLNLFRIFRLEVQLN